MAHYACFPLPSEPLVPWEVFKSFHTIDRNLYSRLVFELTRDPGESMKVMALWLWIEKNNFSPLGYHWILRTLLPSHPSPLNAFADESVAALKTIEWEPSSPAPAPSAFDLPMFWSMTRKLVSLKDFCDNRGNVAYGVNKMLDQVCIRAFQDLMQRALDMRAVAAVEIARTSTQNPAPVPVPMMRMPLRFEPVMMSPPSPPPSMQLPPPPPMQLPPPPPVPLPQPPPQHFVGGMPSVPQYVQQNYVPNGDGGHGFLGSNPNDDLVGVRGINYEDYNFNHDLVEFLMRSLDLNSDREDHYEEDFYSNQPDDQVDLVPADERTIFLTFSRGYPISETEVRDFFTRYSKPKSLSTIRYFLLFCFFFGEFIFSVIDSFVLCSRTI